MPFQYNEHIQPMVDFLPLIIHLSYRLSPKSSFSPEQISELLEFFSISTMIKRQELSVYQIN